MNCRSEDIEMPDKEGDQIRTTVRENRVHPHYSSIRDPEKNSLTHTGAVWIEVEIPGLRSLLSAAGSCSKRTDEISGLGRAKNAS